MLGNNDSSQPNFAFERDLMKIHKGQVAGIDEAGRGPWSGPVVAAAVILDPDNIPAGLNDSKKLSEKKRDSLFDVISTNAHVGVGIADETRIDRDNILQATLWAMAQAASALPLSPVAALIDGNFCPNLNCPTEALVKGDARSLSIAAASIIAKVTRDRIMIDLAEKYPGYGWQRNKGYGTAEHIKGIKLHGITPHHRRSFRPIRQAIEAAVGARQ
jgi:ribonuclease HII